MKTTREEPKLKTWQMEIRMDGLYFSFECEAPDKRTAWSIGRNWHPGACVDEPKEV